jgi:hypothetical protein
MTATSSAYFGVINIANPASPYYFATNTGIFPLPSVPVAVSNFNNRAYFACSNTSYFSDPLFPTQMTNAGQALTHRLTLPAAYQPATPSALLLFFHGWGASPTTCGALCDAEAPAAGFVALSMQGIGSSWNGSGSVASPGARGATCEANATDYCYSDCAAGCADNCWWTTCAASAPESKPPVGQDSATFLRSGPPNTWAF